MKEQLLLRAGEAVCFHGQPYVITRLLSNLEHVLARSVDTGVEAQLPVAVLLPSDATVNVTDREPVAEQLSAAQLAVAQHRLAVLQPLLSPVDGFSSVTAVAEEHGVHPATVYRWRARLEATGRASALANRPGRGGAGRSRLDPAAEAVIQATIEDFFLTKQRRTQAQTCIEVRA